MKPRRLLTIGHSYAVALNRRLADEMARVGRGTWEVAVIAPKFLPGDHWPIAFEPNPDEVCSSEAVIVRFARRIPTMAYGLRVRDVLRGGWDLVHAWEEPYIVAGFQIGWWTPQTVPVVFWTMQNLPKTYPFPFRQMERFTVKRFAGWIAVGQTTAQTQLARGYGNRPHRVLPLGVDTDKFRPDSAAGAAVRLRLGWTANGPPVVGYLGRFVPEKGLTVLIQALDSIASPWRALVVGGGPQEPELRAWAARHGDRVRVVTGVPHDRVPEYLNAMDVLAAPSQTTPTWREQFGRMLIEGFACGCAVVGSDSGEIPHVLADAGLVVPEADVTAWAAVLGELIDNPARRAELGVRGRERAERRFAWPEIARQHLEFFDEIMDSPA